MYPDGRSDMAELQAFVEMLKLLSKLRKEGHSIMCARGQVFWNGACNGCSLEAVQS